MNLISAHFDDFDHFRDSLSGWDVEVTQLSRGPLDLVWDQLEVGAALSLARLKLNRSISDRMAINSSRINFVVCFSPNRFCGLEVRAGSMLIFGPGREYRSILPENFESFEVSVSIDFLRAKGLDVADARFADFQPEHCVIKLTDHTMNLFRRLSNTVSALSTDGPDPTSTMKWRGAISEHAISLIARVLEASDQEKCPIVTKAVPRWSLAAKVLELIDLAESDQPSIQDICQSVDCTPRAVQIAFQNTLGISPTQYMLARRLQCARQDLLEATPDTANVTSISAGHEFFHFGRFSQYYKTMYGERPSDTLKRNYKARFHMR